MDGRHPAFDALGDYRDSAARLLACRSNLYRAAEAAAAQATLDTVAQAIEDFRFLEDYLDSAAARKRWHHSGR